MAGGLERDLEEARREVRVFGGVDFAAADFVAPADDAVDWPALADLARVDFALEDLAAVDFEWTGLALIAFA